MKKYLFLLLLFLQTIIQAQDIYIDSQSDADAFDSSITTITGSLYVSGKDVKDLTNLTNLTTIEGDASFTNIFSTGTLLQIEFSLEQIGGNLAINSCYLESLDGLSNLVSVDGNLQIINVYGLENLNGFGSLYSVEEELNIRDNDDLQEINGFTNLTTINEKLNVTGNATLKSINGFSLLNSVTHDLHIIGNAALESIDGFPNLNSVGTSLYIRLNAVLQNISGFIGLEIIGDPEDDSLYRGFMQIDENQSLQNINGFTNLKTIGSFLAIKNNNALQNISGFPNLFSIGDIARDGWDTNKYLDIKNNNSLEHIDGFPILNSIGTHLEIEDNPALKDINGFQSLMTIGKQLDGQVNGLGYLTINKNNNLLSIDGFSKLECIAAYLLIERNDVLQHINGFSNLNDIGWYLEIERNPDLQNLDGLIELDSIHQYLKIDRNSTLQNVNGLSSLNFIGGNLNMTDNALLQNLDGLVNLTHIGGNLNIKDNLALENIDGLANLNSILKGLMLSDNIVLKNVDAFSNITSLGGALSIDRHPALENIDGLSNLSSINGHLSLNRNPLLQNIDALSNLTSINGYISINESTALVNIDGLSNVTSIGGYLSLNENSALLNTNGLSKIVTKTIDGHVSIQDNTALMSISGLSKLTSLSEYLHIKNNPVLLNINAFSSIISVDEILSISNNNVLDNLDQFSNLTSVGETLSIFNNDALQNLNGLSSVEFVGGDLDVFYNDALQNLNGLSNVVSVGLKLEIEQNINLTNCCGIKQLLVSPDAVGGNISLVANPSECSSQEEIIISCDLPSAKGCMYWDENQNGSKDINEKYLPITSSVLNPENVFTFPYDNGCYTHFLSNGSYVLGYAPDPLWQLTSDPTEYQITINGDSHLDLNFGFIPTDAVTSGQVQASAGLPRCFRDVEFDFNFKNEGTTILNGIMWVQVWDEWMEVSDYVQTPDSVDIANENRWGWFFDDLYPFEVLQHSVTLEMPEIGEAGFILGDSYMITTEVEAYDNTGNVETFTFELEDEIRCAYDPNDKLVSPDREGNENYTLFDEDLLYTIRFQNTGNDTAFNVVIRDTIDENLNLATFKVMASSHQNILRTEISDGENVTFTFEDILLPDSTTNFNGSQGYITYSIKSIEDLDEYTIVENRASIYFDFNPPIITNTTENTLVSCLAAPEFIVNDTIYEVNTFELIDGTIVNESGVYTITLSDENGCDTLIYITELVVLDCPETILIDKDFELEEGEIFTLEDGTEIQEEGTYVTELFDDAGCLEKIITTVISFVTSTNSLQWNGYVSLFPNPTTGKFTLDIQGLENLDHRLIVTNMHGQKLFVKNIRNSRTCFDVGFLALGIYWLQIRTESNELVALQKLVIGM